MPVRPGPASLIAQDRLARARRWAGPPWPGRHPPGGRPRRPPRGAPIPPPRGPGHAACAKGGEVASPTPSASATAATSAAQAARSGRRGPSGHASPQDEIERRRKLQPVARSPAEPALRDRAKITATSERVLVGNGPGKTLEEQARQAVLVGTAVHLLPADLLGRDVGDRAHELAVGRAPLRGALGKAEVREVAVFALVLAIQQNVAGLDVAVHQSPAVSRIECTRDLPGDRDGSLRRQGPLPAEQCARRSRPGT